MTKIAKSPERGSFQKECLLKRVAEGTTTEEHAMEMTKYYESWEEETARIEASDEWKINNMEYDLRSTAWICDKVKADDNYAQNLYAAMCNMQFQRIEPWPILKNDRWSCSWRHAGGIIADMQEKGDYIEWYCSGIRGGYDDSEPDPFPKFVPEGTVTEEIDNDLRKLGWMPVEWDD